MCCIDWDREISEMGIGDMWKILCNKLEKSVSVHVPVFKNKNKMFPKWMTKETRRMRTHKMNLWKRDQTTQDYNDLVNYKCFLNKATTEYRKAKKAFELKLATNTKQDFKSFYSYIRSKSKTKATVGPLKDGFGNLITDDVAMCGILNDFLLQYLFVRIYLLMCLNWNQNSKVIKATSY